VHYAQELRLDEKPCQASELLRTVMASVTTDDINIEYRDSNNACLALTPTIDPASLITPTTEVIATTEVPPTEAPPTETTAP
jgi:hypothetical protein